MLKVYQDVLLYTTLYVYIYTWMGYLCLDLFGPVCIFECVVCVLIAQARGTECVCARGSGVCTWDRRVTIGE